VAAAAFLTRAKRTAAFRLAEIEAGRLAVSAEVADDTRTAPADRGCLQTAMVRRGSRTVRNIRAERNGHCTRAFAASVPPNGRGPQCESNELESVSNRTGADAVERTAAPSDKFLEGRFVAVEYVRS